MDKNILHRMNVDFFKYPWMEMYRKNKKDVQRENAIFTWNSLFFMLVVDVFLTIFFSVIKNGRQEAIRLAAIFPVILLLFFCISDIQK